MFEIIVKITENGVGYFFSTEGESRSLCTGACIFDAVREPEVLKQLSRLYFSKSTFHLLNIPADMHILGKTPREVLTMLKSPLLKLLK